MINFARGTRTLFTALFLGMASGAILAQSPPPGECPQSRFTGKAPDSYYGRPNPLAATSENIAAGEAIFNGDPQRASV